MLMRDRTGGASGKLARLHYLPGTYRLLTAGDHVLCAVSGVQIPLDQLCYWSVERQEAYANARLSSEAEFAARGWSGL